MDTTATPTVTAEITETSWVYSFDGGEPVESLEAIEVLVGAGVEAWADRREILEQAQRVVLLETGDLVPPSAFTVGEPVEVNAFGHWYAGEVVKIGRARITVRYASGTGRVRDKAVNPLELNMVHGSLVRKVAR